MSNLAKKIFLAINYLEAFGNRSALTFLSIVLSPIQKTTLKRVVLKWRRVQDSNLCIVIHDDGLAIRCITTLPTLQLWYGVIDILSFPCRQ